MKRISNRWGRWVFLGTFALLWGCGGGSTTTSVDTGGGDEGVPQSVNYQPQVTVSINGDIQLPMTGSTVQLSVTQ